MSEIDPTNARREFLKRACLLAGGTTLLGASVWSGPSAAAVDARSYASGNYFLELDGLAAGILKSFEGGFAKGEVVNVSSGAAAVTKKHIARYRYEPMAMECELAMPKVLNDWVSATLNGKIQRKSGAIVSANFDYKEKSRLQFYDALISEIGFPALDGASKDGVYLTLKLLPERAMPLAGSDAKVKVDVGDRKNLASTAANFRLSIAGLDCKRVNRIEAFTIKSVLREDKVGAQREPSTNAVGLEFPNLSFSIAEVDAGGFYAWFQDMVVKGNSGDNNERQGTLEYLSHDLKTTLQTVRFANLGIFGFTPDKAEANSEKVKRVRIDLYCEGISLG
jgi:hypothetical protein